MACPFFLIILNYTGLCAKQSTSTMVHCGTLLLMNGKISGKAPVSTLVRIRQWRITPRKNNLAKDEALAVSGDCVCDPCAREHVHHTARALTSPLHIKKARAFRAKE